MEFSLNSEELELLARMLDHRHLEIQKEISRTDHRDFRETLRREEKLIESIISRIQSQTTNRVA